MSHHQSSASRERARLDGLKKLFRLTGPESPASSDAALEQWLVRSSAGENQVLAHRLRRDLARLAAAADATRRAAE